MGVSDEKREEIQDKNHGGVSRVIYMSEGRETESDKSLEWLHAAYSCGRKAIQDRIK